MRWFAVCVLLLTGAAAWYYREPLAERLGFASQANPAPPSQKSPENKNPNSVNLDAEGQKRLGLATAKSVKQKIVKLVRVPGTVAFDERRVTRLKPLTQGRVISLAVQAGDPVEIGQTLATLDASGVLDARSGLDAARATLSQAKAAETVAETALDRAKELLKIGGISQAEVEKRQGDATQAKAATQSAQSQVETYAAQYERLAPASGEGQGTSEIVSPIAGVVTSADITLGEVVDTMRDAFIVADASQVQVLASLYGGDIDIVKAGNPAVIEAPLVGHPRFDGTVRSVNAALDAATGTAPARIEIVNKDGALRANMFVSVEISADLGRSGVTIPAKAVQQSENGPIAFAQVAGDRFERRDLTLGLQRTDWVEVEKGVAEGEVIATDGSFGLKAMLMRDLLGSTD